MTQDASPPCSHRGSVRCPQTRCSRLDQSIMFVRKSRSLIAYVAGPVGTILQTRGSTLRALAGRRWRPKTLQGIQTAADGSMPQQRPRHCQLLRRATSGCILRRTPKAATRKQRCVPDTAMSIAEAHTIRSNIKTANSRSFASLRMTASCAEDDSELRRG
jgi:hypothetical protein